MWLERTERKDGKLVGAAVSPSGARSVVALEDVFTLTFPLERKAKRRVKTQFCDWNEATAKEYVGAFGLTEKIDESHQVFAFKHEGMTVVIPASVLAQALFCPFSKVSTYLFLPQGLDTLCAPLSLESGTVTVDFLPATVSPGTRIRKFQWIYAFPSARKAWDSIYANAINGRLGLRLPKAEVDATIHGKLVRETLYATEFRILALSALEKPYLFANNQRRQYVFHMGIYLAPEHHAGPPVAIDPRLLPSRRGWTLSDREWHEIEPLFESKFGAPPKTMPRRLIIDTVLEKLGTGTPWNKVTFGPGLEAARLYSTWCRDGRWDKLMAVISRHRVRNR